MGKAKHYEIHLTKKQAFFTVLALMVCFLLAFSLGAMIGMKYFPESPARLLSSSTQNETPPPAVPLPGALESRTLSNPEGKEVVEFTFYSTLPKNGDPPVPPKKPSSPADSSTPQEIKREVPPQKYVIQLGSFQQVEKAYALANKLNKQGHLAHVITNTIEKKTWHRVRMGPFNTQEEAQNWASQLPPLHPAPFITSLKD